MNRIGDNIVLFDELHKAVKFLSLNDFKGKTDISAQDIKVSQNRSEFDFYAAGSRFELGIGCMQDFKKAFDVYLKGVASGSASCCLKVAFYYLYGYGIEITSRSLFRLYLNEAVRLGSKEALHYRRMWSGVPDCQYFDSEFSYPVQCIL